MTYSNKNYVSREWRNTSVVKGSCCSCRGPLVQYPAFIWRLTTTYNLQFQETQHPLLVSMDTWPTGYTQIFMWTKHSNPGNNTNKPKNESEQKYKQKNKTSSQTLKGTNPINTNEQTKESVTNTCPASNTYFYFCSISSSFIDFQNSGILLQLLVHFTTSIL